MGLHQTLGTDSKSYFQLSQMEALGMKNNDGQSLHLQTLLLIAKAVNFLKRRFDQFKVNQIYDNLIEIKKLLNIEKVGYGIQLLLKNLFYRNTR
jgi:hypothetical protein